MTLRWDYILDGGTLRVVEWTDRTTGQSIGEIRPPSSALVFPDFIPRFKINKNETEATLTIINVTESDTGEYSCRVQTQDFQQIISTVRLDVLRKYRYLSDRGAFANLHHIVKGQILDVLSSGNSLAEVLGIVKPTFIALSDI